RVGRGEPTDADDRLRRELLEAAEVRLGPRLLAEARRDRVVLPLADHDVPEVRELADEREDLLELGTLEAVGAEELVDHEAARDRSPAVDLIERVLEDLAQEP